MGGGGGGRGGAGGTGGRVRWHTCLHLKPRSHNQNESAYIKRDTKRVCKLKETPCESAN